MENKNNVKCSFIVTILAMITVVFSIATTTSSVLRGVFTKEPDARAELFSLNNSI